MCSVYEGSVRAPQADAEPVAHPCCDHSSLTLLARTTALLDLHRKVLGKIVAAVAHRNEIHLKDTLLHVGHRGDAAHFVDPLVDDRLRRSCQQKHAAPTPKIGAAEAGLGEGGHIRKVLRPLRAGHLDQHDLAGRHLARKEAHRVGDNESPQTRGTCSCYRRLRG